MAHDPKVANMVKKALELMSPSLKKIHEKLGGSDVLSYSSVRAWRSGDRTPSPEHVRRIAELAERQAGQLFKVAAKLESSAERQSPPESSLSHREDCIATEPGESCAPAEGDWNQPSGHWVREARDELRVELGDEPPWCRIHERAWHLIEEEEG